MTKSATPPRKQQNYKLDGPTREALRVMSEMTKRSMAQIIELCVEEYFIKHFEEQLQEKMK